METKLIQNWHARYNYCVICGEKCKGETCKGVCREKLRGLRKAISNQKSLDKERGQVADWTPKTIRQFNLIQETLSK